MSLAPVIVTAPPAAGGSGSSSFAIFRPATASSGPYVQTWVEVAALVAASGITDLFVDPTGLPGGSYPTATAGVINWRGLTTIRPIRNGFGGVFLYLDDGAVFHDFYAVDGQVIIYPQTTSTPAFTWSELAPVVELRNGAILCTGDVATMAPIHRTSASNTIEFWLSGGSALGDDSGVGLVDIDSTVSVQVRVTNNEYANAIGSGVFKGAGSVDVSADETYDPKNNTQASLSGAYTYAFKSSSGSGYLPDRIVDLSAGDVSLLRADSHGRCLVLQGALPSNVTITLADDTRCKIRNECTTGGIASDAYYVTVLGASHGTVWCPPGREIEVYDSTGTGTFREARVTDDWDVDILLSDMSSADGPNYFGVVALPASVETLVLTRAWIKTLTNGVLSNPGTGTVAIELGITGVDNAFLLSTAISGLGGATNAIAGLDQSTLGPAFLAANGYVGTYGNTDAIVRLKVTLGSTDLAGGSCLVKLSGQRMGDGT